MRDGSAKSDWQVRLLERDDEAAFIPLLGQHISDRCVRKHFDWLYRSNPHGNAVTWVAVTAEGRIVGCTSTFPRLLKFNGDEILGSKGGDAYVDPAFRRQGIAQALHHQGIADMKKLGISCNFGIAPVPANFRAFIRAGALSPGNFDNYRMPLDASWIARRLGTGWIGHVAKKVLNPLVRMYVERRGSRRKRFRERISVVDRFDDRVGELFDALSESFSICGKRDSAYLNWRFADHPFKQFTLIECSTRGVLSGYAVLDMNADRCKIVDFLCNTEDGSASFFLKCLIQFARERGKRSISLFLNPIGPYAKSFEAEGFMRAGEELPIMALTTGCPEQDEIFNKAENWYLTPGDEDST
ncbi:MAG: GNAT family N-acetyltransferase [Gammaproteobacteria bacterium]|nr:GNAT family N-acetyltransferase [Gammaproteobacteria bacterium]